MADTPRRHRPSISNIAALARCEAAYIYNRRYGTRIATHNRAAAREGEREHVRDAKLATHAARDSRCFIAGACLGEDHPATAQLRGYRDVALRPSLGGRFVIGVYEAVSPPIAQALRRWPRLAHLIGTRVLIPLAQRLSA